MQFPAFVPGTMWVPQRMIPSIIVAALVLQCWRGRSETAVFLGALFVIPPWSPFVFLGGCVLAVILATQVRPRGIPGAMGPALAVPAAVIALLYLRSAGAEQDLA